jgi:hypothetical protein
LNSVKILFPIHRLLCILKVEKKTIYRMHIKTEESRPRSLFVVEARNLQ